MIGGLPAITVSASTRIVEVEDWTGAACHTGANATVVARAFAETSRRRGHLSFTHHTLVASLPPDEADPLLNSCREQTVVLQVASASWTRLISRWVSVLTAITSRTRLG